MVINGLSSSVVISHSSSFSFVIKNSKIRQFSNENKSTCLKYQSSMTLLFYYLVPLQNHCLVTSQCMQFTFEDKEKLPGWSERALPVTKKEWKGEGKKSICPWIKYGHANLNSYTTVHYTDLFLSFCFETTICPQKWTACIVTSQDSDFAGG